MNAAPQLLQRWWRRLDTAAALRRARWLGPLLFGLLALRYGQDDNWDLHNYHLYNPFALLHGKIGYDLAPGQWQSYFNPTLDLPYYGLIMTLPAPLATLLMGALHGLNFVLLLALGRALLPAGADGKPPYALTIALALAGCLGPAFISGLGNTMGDNLTALLVLSALLLLVRGWPRLRGGGRAGALTALGAGVLAGAAAGLKPTNAGYALALCLALPALDAGWRQRGQAMMLFSAGVLAGIAASAGHWYWRMWRVFGNPLFPQFNDIFHGPLARAVGIGDTGWLPHGALEKWLWPFIIFIDPRRISELPLRSLIWPLLYLVVAALALRWIVRLCRRRDGGAAPDAMAPQLRLLLLFAALSYLIWLNLFSIYRYLAPLELLAPLLLWLLLPRLLPPARARAWGVACLLLAICSTYAGGRSDWGHAGRVRQAYAVETPVLADPAQSMVLMLHAPMGWLVPFFPDRLAFASLGSGFPESPAYAERVHAMLAARSGPAYVMLHLDARDLAAPRSAAQQRRLDDGAVTLARYGLAMDAAACRSYPARVGTNRYAYQLCPLLQPGRAAP